MLISNTSHTASTNAMNIATIGKDSVTVSIMDIAPANALIHRKSALFEHLVRTVSTLKGLNTSSELIHLMRQDLPVDTRYRLQEAQSVSNSVRDWVIGIATLEPQAFLDVNMDEVTIDLRNKPAKRSPRIKLTRFCFTAKGGDLDSNISPGAAFSFEFYLWLNQHSLDSVLDEIQILNPPAKVLRLPVSSMEYTNDATPRTPESQKTVL